jgi:GDPmannose 4,6-dehydratase
VLLGDASKAKEHLGWEASVNFQDLARMMVDADCEALEHQLAGKVTRYSHEST